MSVILYRRHQAKSSQRKGNANRQNGCLRRFYKQLRKEVKSKEERDRYVQLNAEFLRIARRDKKAFLNEQCKEIEENNRRGKTTDFVKKLVISREHFMQGRS